MRNRFTLSLLLLVATAMTLVGKEPERPYKKLVENSPFLTPAFKASLAHLGHRKSVSWNGYTKVGKTWFFALKHVKSGKHYWVAEGAEADGIKVVSFKPEKELINVKVGEIAFDLSLEKK